jgi:hypothetical protein
MKKIIIGLALLTLAVGSLKAESFEAWSRERRAQWADDQAAWQDQWERQAIQDRLDAIEAQLGGE